tara:strand:+ start:1701 stop:2780 length:1080 start_codon:yes stop_codon:yes gene_type:complete
MKIELQKTTVRELAKDYEDNLEDGVFGYGGKLDIRPPYQREFVYKDRQRDAVINTVFRNFPLNVMYWSKREDGNYEIIDGQQRTISICQYIDSEFSFEKKYFHNLDSHEKDNILNYELTIYVCSGSDSEKLDWFKTINIAGEKLTNQELRNAVYHGPWVSDAKRYFSKTGCPAYKLGGDYLNGTPIRQDYLETVIKWINDDEVDDYMAQNQKKPDASELWDYYQNVIAWVKSTFTIKRKKFMQGVPWGILYNQFKTKVLDPKKLEEEVIKLIADEEVTNTKGIYQYVLTRKEKFLNIRRFSDQVKLRVFEKQGGKCNKCGAIFDISEMDGDHIKKWVDGGKTDETNCQMLCIPCNRGGN